ncbi:hypothetical protein D477_008933 [Arthrobacter crystallopoietes BAB-32]|uniref:DUF4244 domain-containing protein n=1 Tax=Arthrobacter crystallopoietes BAB-32 TaxID=1246476 RepID=N1UVT7_9MICC|nr:DUF4244 domain-containing protein [Arthrobacter crystallopoietes]EMY34521.1 hypothetical protein D477_008933 [Arthrobacter crystallopoietes BAB-32]
MSSSSSSLAARSIIEAEPGEARQEAEVIEFPTDRNSEGSRRWRDLVGSEAGMATAEYAIATLAAVAFAGLLVLILRSGEVRGLLMNLVELALTAV